jgi:uncharacterized membrane protein YccC
MPANVGLPELLILLAIACAFIGHKLARSKNQPGWIGAVLGFFLGLIGLLILAVLPRRVENSLQTSDRAAQNE